MKKNVVILTGAGISAESNIDTYRDIDGVWSKYDVEEVATYGGWLKSHKTVLDFYNMLKEKYSDAKPNDAHKLLAELEQDENYNVQIITQNVDMLHEMAGSKNVIHMHGDMNTACNKDRSKIIEIGIKPINIGDMIDNEQLRPNVVFFAEAVLYLDDSIKIMEKADIVAVIGTSMQVYPFASLIDYVIPGTQKVLINMEEVPRMLQYTKFYEGPATECVPEFLEDLRKDIFIL